MAEALGASGQRDAAEAVYAEMLARARREYASGYFLATAAVAVGRLDEAIAHARLAWRSASRKSWESRESRASHRCVTMPGTRSSSSRWDSRDVGRALSALGVSSPRSKHRRIDPF